MLSILWFAMDLAGAAEASFAITTAAGTFEFTSFPSPPPRTTSPGARTCTVELGWDGTRPLARTWACPAETVSDVLAALGTWQVTGPTAPVERIGELWFVYPVDRPAKPRVMVRQALDQDLSLPASVDVVPFAIRAWSFLKYPADLYAADRPDVTCQVALEADPLGVPSRVDVQGCDAPYAASVTAAMRDWRFDPPQVDGHPMPSALSLRVTFIAEEPPATEERPEPSAESRALWNARQFDALTRADRLWFIEDALLNTTAAEDLGPGQVKVALPAPADLGPRDPPRFFLPPVREPIQPLPPHPAVLEVDGGDGIGVSVYELVLPRALVDRRVVCPTLVQVDGRRDVFSWVEPGCDPAVRRTALAAADHWVMKHDGPEEDTARARFRVTFTFEPRGTEVEFDAVDVKTAVAELPSGVHVVRAPKVIRQLAVRVPRSAPALAGTCALGVTVSDKGRPVAIDPITCAEPLAAIATKSVRRWRWAPGTRDDVPVAATTEVTVGFAAP